MIESSCPSTNDDKALYKVSTPCDQQCQRRSEHKLFQTLHLLDPPSLEEKIFDPTVLLLIVGGVSTRFCDRSTDWRTDRKYKNNMSPRMGGGDIILTKVGTNHP
jgi:hypothetical protein